MGVGSGEGLLPFCLRPPVSRLFLISGSGGPVKGGQVLTQILRRPGWSPFYVIWAWPSMAAHCDPSSSLPLRGLREAVGDGEREERPDSHLAYILGETARNIFRSSLNREERKEREGRKTRIMHYFSSK